MATMRGGAVVFAGCCLDQASVSYDIKRTQFSPRGYPQGQNLSAAVLRGGVKALPTIASSSRKGLVRASGLRSDGLGICKQKSSSPGVSLPRLFGRESFGLGSSSITGRQKSACIVVQARKDSIDAPERILAALGYILPFFDGIQYGRYFFLQYPVAENLLRPLYPLLSVYKGFPYSNLIAFFSLYLLVVRNQSFSRYVRFNAMQAVVLDVLLILPTLVERTFAPRGGLGFDLLIIFYNTVFLFLVTCFLFGVFSCLLGKTPRLPIVADAADAQV